MCVSASTGTLFVNTRSSYKYFTSLVIIPLPFINTVSFPSVALNNSYGDNVRNLVPLNLFNVLYDTET